jgi:CBS domain-containing protein
MALLVRHVMAEVPEAVPPETTVDDAAVLMANHDIGMVPVIDEERHVLGVVTDRDLVLRVLAFRQHPAQVPVRDVMTQGELVTLSPDAQISQARDLMAERRVRRVLVTKEDRLVGVISIGDVAEADASKRAVGEALGEISASEETTKRNRGPAAGTPARVRG